MGQSFKFTIYDDGRGDPKETYEAHYQNIIDPILPDLSSNFIMDHHHIYGWKGVAANLRYATLGPHEFKVYTDWKSGDPVGMDVYKFSGTEYLLSVESRRAHSLESAYY